ncbi:MAG: hypothetical protein QW343_01310 [Candidatus Norongarragalinales archaeon]
MQKQVFTRAVCATTGANSLEQMKTVFYQQFATRGKRQTSRRPFSVVREQRGINWFEFLESEGKLLPETNHILVCEPVDPRAKTVKVALLKHEEGKTQLLKVLTVKKWWQAFQ